MTYSEYWDKIYKKNMELNHLLSSYWRNYSYYDTWQFWIVAFLLVAPLILLCFVIDRKRIFEIFFFGYTVHMLWTYIENVFENQNYIHHTYFLFPFLPFSFDITASVLPVGYLLLYQYCSNKGRNFYLLSVLLSLLFAFFFATIEKFIGLVEFSKGVNQFHLFLVDIVVSFIAYWFTRFLVNIKFNKSK